MIDLNTLVSNALSAAVQEAIAPLNNRIVALEEQVTALTTRVVALENNPAQGVDTQAVPTSGLTRDEVEALNSQEWFWAKVADFIERDISDRGIVSEMRVEELVQEAMDDHCSTYDHDDYDNHIGDDDKHFDGDIEDAVRDTISNMSFEVSIS